MRPDTFNHLSQNEERDSLLNQRTYW